MRFTVLFTVLLIYRGGLHLLLHGDILDISSNYSSIRDTIREIKIDYNGPLTRFIKTNCCPNQNPL
jgi:hypothetical protein